MSERKVLDSSTEERIIAAAKKIFTQKGYSATKVRDIAAEADINLSLVNYYFRSKEKLFELIMTENIEKLFHKIGPVLNDEKTSLREKVSFIVEHYINMLIENPDLPVFIVNEVMSGSNKIPAITSKKELIRQSNFYKQVWKLREEGRISYHPLQFMMNLLGMLVMPFLGRNLFMELGVSKREFDKLIAERKGMIPVWIDSLIGS